MVVEYFLSSVSGKAPSALDTQNNNVTTIFTNKLGGQLLLVNEKARN